MDVLRTLVDLLARAKRSMREKSGMSCELARNIYVAEWLISNGVTVQEAARPAEEWSEDYGDVLWWKFPIEEPPYVGSPLDLDWPAYHTHWTPIHVPVEPKEG